MNKNLNNKHNGAARNGGFFRVFAMALVIVAFAGMASAQDNVVLKFKGGIGVIPVTGVNATTGAANLNIVRGVNPAGPWRIADLDALVESNGHIRVRGRGLLLAAGNGIGTNASASVHATLFCGPAATATAFDEAGVALDADGDFTIDDVLLGNVVFPGSCQSPVLLIRSGKLAGQGVWFAAGIPKVEGN